MNQPPAPVSAMLPAHQRIDQTLETIHRLQACDPPPAEILVHVARSQAAMLEALERIKPAVRILTSEGNLGPGGARNRMIAEARHEIVASFDDDSYPVDPGFFGELPTWFERLPVASILALNIFEQVDPEPSGNGEPREVTYFVGCGCAYRRSHFLKGDGYVPIPIAYSMEEADLALRYAARGRTIWYVPALRVYHDTVLSHHASAKVAAMQVANTALFAFLRYPLGYWPLGMAQVANKWVDTLKRRRWMGSILALPLILSQIFRYRTHRAPVPKTVLHQRRARINTKD